MIDTDKYEGTDHPELVEFEGETLGDTLTNLITEVKRLREVAYRKDMQVGERDREVKRLRKVLKDIHYDLTFKGTPEEMNSKALSTLSEVMYVD